ncbi:MAG TPA: ABC transporter substrate-binding protein [Vicinamibacteria bacterium]|nr:ABC transporter substrate-binding protein [Vicinamibacteria bacterium]
MTVAADSRLGSVRVFSVAIAGLISALYVAAEAPSPSPAGKTAVLTASPGPRQNPWKRSFNPFRGDAEFLWPASAGVYEPLLVYNRATGRYLSWLATSYAWSPDNLKLRFAIRPGVLWSDGVAFAARDVTFTFELMRRVPALDRQGIWTFLSSVSAISRDTVEFTLKRPFTPGLASIGQCAIVSEHKWKDIADPAAFDDPAPVGTGPFTEVKRFEPMLYELGRNPKYWQAGKPAVELLRVPLYRSNDDVFRALQAGVLDWASLFLPDVEKSWVAADPAHRQYWFPDFGPMVLLYLNTQQKPLDDRNVRMALSMALDRPRIVKEALNNYVAAADTTGLADSQRNWKDAGLLAGNRWTIRDVGRANQLLDAAGLARGSGQIRLGPSGPLRYELNVVKGWTDWVAAAEIIGQNLAEIGVAVSVKALDYNAWDDALRRGRFALSMGFGSRGPDPCQFYRDVMDGSLVRPVGERAEANFNRFASDDATQLVRRFEALSDEKEQRPLAIAMQRLFIMNAPSLPLFASPLWGVFNTTHLSGFPTRFRPFASAVPGVGPPPGGTDALPVLVEVQPR